MIQCHSRDKWGASFAVSALHAGCFFDLFDQTVGKFMKPELEGHIATLFALCWCVKCPSKSSAFTKLEDSVGVISLFWASPHFIGDLNTSLSEAYD